MILKFMKLLLVSLLILIGDSLMAQDQMFDICPLKVGEELPIQTEIYTEKGEPIKLENVLKNEPTVLVFYRGGWCPYCTRQLSGLQAVKLTIDSLGYQTVAVCPDDFTKLDSSLKESGASYQLYSDKKADLIQAFGLGWALDDELFNKYKNKYGLDLEEWSGEKHHVLPVPAVYIIVNNEVVFNYINPKYSTRLEPETLIALLSSIKLDKAHTD